MNQIAKLYPEGWLRYCPECWEYMDQSDPQNDSRRKSVIIDSGPCPNCTKKREEEVQEAQSIMGRLGVPKENSDSPVLKELKDHLAKSMSELEAFVQKENSDEVS